MIVSFEEASRRAQVARCLTVSLINPHDREFYPAGTEYQTVTDLFTSPDTNPTGLVQMQAGYGTEAGTGPVVPWDENALKDPPSYGYPTLPPNYETRDQLQNKPSTQVFIHDFSEGVWGGATNDPSQNNATVERYPSPRPELKFGIAKMPFSYWQRGLDSYTQVMEIVDVQIGRVLDQLQELPRSVVDNTVIVFASDHGDYSGAHGLLQGKMGSVYEEAYHIPLIVVDPSSRFTGDIEKIRTGLTSSIDFSTLLVSIGNGGTRDWMTGDLAQIYGDRHDMISMLNSADAPGRPYILQATDEVVPDYFNFNAAATHVLGFRTSEYKLGVYTKWIPLTSRIIAPSIELEFYDYSTSGGQLELTSTPEDPRVQGLLSNLLVNIIPNELEATLPGTLGIQQEISKIAHLAFRELIQLQPAGVWMGGHGLQTLLGFGLEF